MTKQVEINYIEDNDLARMNLLREYSVGSWVLCKTPQEEHLCVIAQIDTATINLIAISESDEPSINQPNANRMQRPFYLKGTHNKLSVQDINDLTNGGKWTLTKVNVQISVYINESPNEDIDDGPTPFTSTMNGGSKRKSNKRKK